VSLRDARGTFPLRERIFNKPTAPDLFVVMSESSLRRMQGTPDVMRAQIDYLITLSRRPNIQLQVLPFRTSTYHGASVSQSQVTEDALLSKFELHDGPVELVDRLSVPAFDLADATLQSQESPFECL
jgi:hypothetical protein